MSSETFAKVHWTVQKGIVYPHYNTGHSDQLFCLIHPLTE